jgi:hypothetical protein
VLIIELPLAVLQYTIRVLAGCNRSPTSAILSAIARTSILAWRWLTQCTTGRVGGGNRTPRRSQNRA